MSTDNDRHTPCEDWSLEAIHAFLDGDKNSLQMQAFRAHLDHCADCQNQADHATQTRQALGQLPSLPCPDHVLASLRRRTRSANPPSTLRGPFRSVRSLGLLAAAAVLFLAFTLRPQPISIPAPAPPSPPVVVASTEQLLEAEREVKLAVTLLRAVGRRSASIATEEVVEQGLIAPARKLSLALLESSFPPKPDTTSQP